LVVSGWQVREFSNPDWHILTGKDPVDGQFRVLDVGDEALALLRTLGLPFG